MSNNSHTPNPPQKARRTPAAPIITRFTEIPRGRVRTWFCPDVVNIMAQLDSTASLDSDTSLVAVAWPPGADLTNAIGPIVHALAGVAWARWPDWYGEAAPFSQPDVGVGAAADYDGRVIDRLGITHPTLNRAWVGQALRRCRQGKRPVLNAFPPTVQMRQLMETQAQADMVLLLALEDTRLPSPGLLYFAQTAARVAGETGARVAAFVPAVYRETPELDAIAYGATHLTDKPEPVTQGAGTALHPGLRTDKPSKIRTQAKGPRRRAPTPAPLPPHDEPARLVVPPILGQPHPASPGEQCLAAWLARDAELAPLFEFNQRVDTTGGEHYVVDLLWRAGYLVVEVDGYTWHSSPHAFSSDRYRDYRLLCEGYHTLRLPHDEVMDDPALQCEKIRDVVHAIREEIAR